MATAKAKTINLLLNEGTLKGVISMEASSWNSGELFSAPRDSVDDLIKSEACSKYGVYLLLSDDMVYVGQSSDLAKRIKQHIIGKSWWERVVILTTSNDKLDRSDIDYLEAVLIEKAGKSNRLDCDNKNKGNNPKIDKFRKVVLEQYLEEALFMMELIGITVFDESSGTKKKPHSGSLISSVEHTPKSQLEIRAKKEAKKYLEELGIELGKVFNYAKRQDEDNVFWMNPRVDALSAEWDIVLNNQFLHELIILHVPVNKLHMIGTGADGLFPRHDKPDYIDANIDANTLIERRSKIDFSTYVVRRITY